MEILTNIQKPFSNLSFKEEEHKYFVEGQPLDTSVSGKISNYYEKFNAEAKAKEWETKRGIPAEVTLAEWKAINDESKERGNRVHNFGERYQFDRRLIPSCPQELAITKFWNEVPEHIISVAAEFRMYHFRHLFAGTADVILFDTKTQTYIIADYKTNKDLYKNFMGKRMLPPFGDILDSPFGHYELQLSYYQILLEQLGVTVSRRIVVWLGMDGTYQNLDTRDLTERIKATLN